MLTFSVFLLLVRIAMQLLGTQACYIDYFEVHEIAQSSICNLRLRCCLARPLNRQYNFEDPSFTESLKAGIIIPTGSVFFFVISCFIKVPFRHGAGFEFELSRT